MLATKDASKEKEVTEKKEVKETKPAAKVEKKTEPKKDDFAVRHLTEEENESLMDDKEPPEGYANKPVEIPVEKEEAEEEGTEEEKPEAKKTEEKPDEKKTEEKKDFFERVETELTKAEGKEDLKDFTPREKAYFYQMRRDRKLRQEAEADRDAALFRESKSKLEKKEEKPKEIDPLEGKDPDDFLTVGEVREILKKQEEKPAEDRTQKEDKALKVMQMNYLKLSEKEAKIGRDDFDAVMELASDLISKDEKALREVGERAEKGENPAVVMYDIIKNHKEFETLYPAAEVKAKAKKAAAEKKDTSVNTSSVTAPTPEDKAKEEKAKQVEKTLEENTNRPKTTAHVSSVESKPAGELTMEEIAGMSDLAFAKLPKNVREKYLKKFG